MILELLRTVKEKSQRRVDGTNCVNSVSGRQFFPCAIVFVHCERSIRVPYQGMAYNSEHTTTMQEQQLVLFILQIRHLFKSATDRAIGRQYHKLIDFVHFFPSGRIPGRS